MEARRQVQPMGVGDVLDGMFRIFKDHWRTFAVAVGVFVVPLNLLSAYVQRDVVSMGMWSAFTDPGAFSGSQGTMPTGVSGASALIGLLSAVVITPLLVGISVTIAAEGWRGDRPQPGAAVRAGARRLLPLIATFIIIGLTALLGGLAAGLLAGAAAALIAASGQAGVAVAVALLLGLLIFAGLLALLLLFALAPVAVVLEERGPFGAMGRSWTLVRRRFWARTGTLLLVFIVVGIIAMILTMPLSLIGSGIGGTVGWVLLALGGMVSGMITTPVGSVGLTLVYLDARIRAEGLDLQLLADELAAGGAPAASPDEGQGGGPGW